MLSLLVSNLCDMCQRKVVLVTFTILSNWLVYSPAVAQPQVYRDRVEPQWFGDQTKFWYRVDLSKGRREFQLVDATAGIRKPAFDHANVAMQLKKLLSREISAEQLPIESLEFSDDGTLLLVSSQGKFRLNQATEELSRIEPRPGDLITKLFLPIQPSGSSSQDTELVIQNELDHPVLMFWVDGSRTLHEYGSVAPKETRRQHTFASHVWLFRNPDGTDMGCFRALPNASQILINPTTLESVSRAERPRRRERADVPEKALAPDGQTSVFCKDSNLWLHVKADQCDVPLTTAANEKKSFRKDATHSRGVSMDYDLPDFGDSVPDVRWSHDSTHVLAFQTTQVVEKLVHYVESTPTDQLLPKLQTYPYFRAGDAIPVQSPRLFRISDRQEVPILTELFPNPWSLEFLRWSDDGSRFWLLYNERGHQRLRVLEVLTDTGAVRCVVDEHSDTFIHYSTDGKFELRWLPNDQLLWASERSGWNHLYRYDVKSGEAINALTSGEWNVRRIEHIDETAGIVWFYAMGIREGQDPYHEHFCRVNFDGSDLKILTEGDGTHEITWSPDRRWFLDRYSRVDLPPITELRAAEGQQVCELEAADASEIIADRGTLPERFVAKGRDGRTDIWGIVHRPRNFDPAKTYPVVENIYAGPHDYHVPKDFQNGFGHQHRIVDAGFIVVQIDGMGTAWRSKAFHDVCYRNLKDAGLPDRILWMKALQEKMPQLDLTRVGIYGGSAGGQNAMSALLWHGDFYKAAVADCGCHDNRMDKIWWNEQWMGFPSGDHYEQNSNMVNAHLLQGQLMLVVGELDRNVDPATSTQVAKKLVDAGKDFDFVVVPGAGHGACETPWASKKRIAFFQRALRAETAATPAP